MAIEIIWLVVWNIFYFSIQSGMSSSQLTLSPSFSRGVGGSTTNQSWKNLLNIHRKYLDELWVAW